ncbi:hypothetical protein FB451DRAFT_1486538 [Mycena latifolia]|nr:hypothetical protein FB451DRAFT_1486538 [Mycena latifolia]
MRGKTPENGLRLRNREGLLSGFTQSVHGRGNEAGNGHMEFEVDEARGHEDCRMTRNTSSLEEETNFQLGVECWVKRDIETGGEAVEEGGLEGKAFKAENPLQHPSATVIAPGIRAMFCAGRRETGWGTAPHRRRARGCRGFERALRAAEDSLHVTRVLSFDPRAPTSARGDTAKRGGRRCCNEPIPAEEPAGHTHERGGAARRRPARRCAYSRGRGRERDGCPCERTAAERKPIRTLRDLWMQDAPAPANGRRGRGRTTMQKEKKKADKEKGEGGEGRGEGEGKGLGVGAMGATRYLRSRRRHKHEGRSERRISGSSGKRSPSQKKKKNADTHIYLSTIPAALLSSTLAFSLSNFASASPNSPFSARAALALQCEDAFIECVRGGGKDAAKESERAASWDWEAASSAAGSLGEVSSPPLPLRVKLEADAGVASAPLPSNPLTSSALAYATALSLIAPFSLSSLTALSNSRIRMTPPTRAPVRVRRTHRPRTLRASSPRQGCSPGRGRSASADSVRAIVLRLEVAYPLGERGRVERVVL